MGKTVLTAEIAPFRISSAFAFGAAISASVKWLERSVKATSLSSLAAVSHMLV